MADQTDREIIERVRAMPESLAARLSREQLEEALGTCTICGAQDAAAGRVCPRCAAALSCESFADILEREVFEPAGRRRAEAFKDPEVRATDGVRPQAVRSADHHRTALAYSLSNLWPDADDQP